MMAHTTSTPPGNMSQTLKRRIPKSTSVKPLSTHPTSMFEDRPLHGPRPRHSSNNYMRGMQEHGAPRRRPYGRIRGSWRGVEHLSTDWVSPQGRTSSVLSASCLSGSQHHSGSICRSDVRRARACTRPVSLLRPAGSIPTRRSMVVFSVTRPRE